MAGGVDIVALALSASEHAAARVLRAAPLVPTARLMVAIGVMLMAGTFGAVAGMSDDSRRAKTRQRKHRPDYCQAGHLPTHII